MSLKEKLKSGGVQAAPASPVPRPGPVCPACGPRSRPVRVLFVNDHLGYEAGVTHGGTTYFSNTLTNFFPDIVEPQLCILGPWHPAAESFHDLGISPIFCGRAKWDPRSLFDLVRVIRERKVDIVHLATMKSSLMGAIAARLTGKPAVLHLHDLAPLKPGLQVVQRYLSARIDWTIAVSEPVRLFGIKEYGVPAERIEVIPNGISLAFSAEQRNGSRQRTRRELKIGEATPVLGITSRLFPGKGHLSLINALPAIRARCADAVLLIAGDGPTRPKCEALVEKLGLHAAVRFLGHRSDIAELLAAIDVLVMPSTVEEGFGYSALEAIAAGRPVVAFASDALSEIVLHGRTGMLVDNGDIVGLAARVSELLENNELARRLGDAGPSHAQNFGIAYHSRRLEALYLSLAANTDHVAGAAAA